MRIVGFLLVNLNGISYTGLIAREPELLIAGEQITWRVPIVLSLPTLGDVGQVGAVDADYGGFHALVLVGITPEDVALHDPTLEAGPTRLSHDGFLMAWEEFDCLAAVIS